MNETNLPREIIFGAPATYKGVKRIMVYFEGYTKNGFDPLPDIPLYSIEKPKGKAWSLYVEGDVFKPDQKFPEHHKRLIADELSLADARELAKDQLAKAWALHQLGWTLEDILAKTALMVR